MRAVGLPRACSYALHFAWGIFFLRGPETQLTLPSPSLRLSLAAVTSPIYVNDLDRFSNCCTQGGVAAGNA